MDVAFLRAHQMMLLLTLGLFFNVQSEEESLRQLHDAYQRMLDAQKAFEALKVEYEKKTGKTWTAPAQSLRIKLIGAGVVFLHRVVEGEILVENNADKDLEQVELTLTLCPELDYISSLPEGKFTPAVKEKPATVRWSLGTLPAKKRVEIKFQVRCAKQGVAMIGAKAVSKQGVFGSSASIKITGVPAMHISTYDTEDPVELGKQTIYVIEARNEGTADCTNVKFEDLIPEEMECVSAQGPTNFKAEGRTIRFEPVPKLAPGDKLVFRIVCRATKEGSAKNRAQIAYDQFETPIVNEEGTSCYK